MARALATSGVTGGARFCGNIGVGGTRFGLDAADDGVMVLLFGVVGAPLPGEMAAGLICLIRAKRNKKLI